MRVGRHAAWTSALLAAACTSPAPATHSERPEGALHPAPAPESHGQWAQPRSLQLDAFESHTPPRWASPPSSGAEASSAQASSAQASRNRVSAWEAALSERVEEIRSDFPGEFGVLVKHLDTGAEVAFDAEHPWYLASTVKVPVAIAVLERVQAGELSLEQHVELQESDFVDGAGDLKWASPGDVFSVGELLERSIEHSDSMATDLLIGLVGLHDLNDRVRRWGDGGFGPLTTILQVRYDAYGVLDPGIANLPSRTFLELRAAGDGEARLRRLAQRLGRERHELSIDSLDDLFERYYAQGKNSAHLDAYGRMLERLVRGELLDGEHLDLLLGHMKRITTGARRIAAGLPAAIPFAQKTGTQIARACNVGVAHPKEPSKQVVIVACAARYGALRDAELAFEGLGRALGDVGFEP